MRNVGLVLLGAVLFVAGCSTTAPAPPDPKWCTWRMEDSGRCPLPPLLFR